MSESGEPRAMRRANVCAPTFVTESIMPFRIIGLDATRFSHLKGLSDEHLAVHRAKRYVVNESPGFPDRIEMRDCAVGETVLLVNFEHQPADSPYRASHAVYVREGAIARYDQPNAIPNVLKRRLLSIRAFDHSHMMIDADVVEGEQTETLIEKFLTNPRADYLHVHFARRGCYAARVERVAG
jgi:Protein of unknown function (DUF1203)